MKKVPFRAERDQVVRNALNGHAKQACPAGVERNAVTTDLHIDTFINLNPVMPI